MAENTNIFLAGGIVAGLYLASQMDRTANANITLDTTPLSTGQPGGAASLEATPRVPTAANNGAGRFIVVESVDTQHHLDDTHWDSIRTRISRAINWIETQAKVTSIGQVTINCDLEPYYIVAPWTQAEIAAQLSETDPDRSTASATVLALIEESGLADGQGFIGAIVDGFQGSAWSWIYGPYTDGSLPPLFITGDCVMDTWIAEDVPDAGVIPVCADFVGFGMPAGASTADGQLAAFIHELFHTIGGPWLDHDSGVMYNWWDFPNISLSDPQAQGLASGGFLQ